MIYLLPTLTRYFMQCSLFTFLEKVSKKRHPSRIAPLSRSFGMTFSFINNEAIANAKLFDKENLDFKTKLFEENK